VLAVQAKQPAAGIHHFKVALEAHPEVEQFWLSYIEALVLGEQADIARQVLEQGRSYGLQGERVDALVARLAGWRQADKYLDKEHRHDVHESPAIPQNAKRQTKLESSNPAKNGKKANLNRMLGNKPTQQEARALITLFSQGRYAEIEAHAGEMVARFPGYGFGWKILGATLVQQGRIAEAITPMQKAVNLLPADYEARSNLGHTLHELGRFVEAETRCRQALELMPDYAEAHNNLGNTLNELGRFTEAEAHCRRALELRHDYVEAHSNLGNILRAQGRLAEAEASYRQALKINPDFAKGYSNLGVILQEQGRATDAEINQRRALELQPGYAKGHSNLGVTLQSQGRFTEAEASYRRALEIKPDYAEAYSNLSITLMEQGRLTEAETSCLRALEIKHDYAEAYSNMLFCRVHQEVMDTAALFDEHCRFGERFETPMRSHWPQHDNLRESERHLQIGFVSGDFRNHAVASFFEPVAAYLFNYPQLSLHAYYSHTIEDSVTERLKVHFSRWHPIAGLTDAALAEKIRTDGIDILIDLSGHTAKHRLLTFARKPAPVQASWIGYPGTTGLKAVDYYLSDRFFLPYGQFDSQFTEKIVQMPASVPFLPFEDAPPVNVLPALGNGYVTFGSFNRPSKLSRAVIALWAQLLRALPDSRMVLGAMPQDGKNDLLINWFAQEGIARERLDFYKRSGMGCYLSLHQQVDICLDTFPYAGGTTTLHALWMGVPTLTLAGGTIPGRTGAGILGHAGLEAFVANNAADFVQKGLAWAGDLAALSGIRAGLRERFAQSAMGQPAVVAAGVERALRIMWQRWCAGLPPESFEVTLQDVNSTMQEFSK